MKLMTGDRVGWCRHWLDSVQGATAEMIAMRGTVEDVLTGKPFTRVKVKWDGESEAKSSRQECLKMMDNAS